MASLTRTSVARRAAAVLPGLAGLAVLACSPEASRVRDGGPGADPNNKVLVASPRVNPGPADTTLWPGRAPTPVERLARGEVPPPAGTSPAAAPGKAGQAPVTPNVPASAAERRTFDESRSADPRRPSSGQPSPKLPQKPPPKRP
jgi:hypothetical protein